MSGSAMKQGSRVASRVAPLLWAAGLALLAGLVGSSPADVAGVEPVGIVESIEGEPTVIRADAEEAKPLSLHAPGHLQDIVETDEDSLVAITFVDDTTITLGEDTSIEINEYLYDAGAEKRSARFTVSEGIIKVAVRTILPDSQFEVQTSTTVASVRATVWVSETRSDRTALVALEGSVAVRSADPGIAGEVVLESGEGVEVGMGQAPATKGRWRQGRIAEFKRRTTIE